MNSRPPPSAPRNVKRPRTENAPSSSGSKEEASPQPPSVVRSVRPPAPRAPLGPRLRSAGRKLWAGFRIVLGVVAVVAASVGAAWGAKSYVTKSPRFAIKTITVEGANRLKPDEIAAAGHIAVGQNVFALDLDQAKREIEKQPYVSEATVTRKLPGTVSIKVTERVPAALVELDGSLYLASAEGEVFKEMGEGDQSDLPVITGIRPDLAVHDRAGMTLLVRRAMEVVDEFDRTGVVKRYPIQEIHLEKDGSVIAIVGREGISVHLGNPPFKGKIEQADRVFSEIAKRKSNASVVFLDNDSSPDRVVVRMK